MEMKRTKKPLQSSFLKESDIHSDIFKALSTGYSGLYLDVELLAKYGPEEACFFAYLRKQAHAQFIQFGNFDPFPLKHAQIESDLHMNVYVIRQLKKALKKKGVISTKMKGLPPVEYYTIHKAVF